jgi:L-fuculose-phosphate aldolase
MISGTEAVEEEELRREIIWASRLMWEKGYVVGTSGNISARIGDSDRLLITPAGAPYDSMKAEDVILCSLDGNVIGGVGRPSSELPLHSAVYIARADARAIVHTHSIYATAIAATRADIPFFMDEMYYVTGPVAIPTAQYARSGTEALARNVVASLGKSGKAALMANHGLVAVGKNMRNAFTIAETVEKAAMVLILAKLYGSISTLEGNFVEDTAAKQKGEGQRE